MKKFVLIVQYLSGEIAILVNTPDLVEALNIFQDKLNEQGFNTDKSCPMPEIKLAKIIPVMHESIYKRGEK